MRPMRVRWIQVLAGLILVAAAARPGLAEEGRVTAVSHAPFARVAEALERAIAAERMTLVCQANAQRGAAGRGVAIKGNQVFMVFRNDLAVRLIAADPLAGFEAPVRLYLYENPDGTATLAYVRPSALFARFGHPEVRAVAAELEPIVKTIADRALATD